MLLKYRYVLDTFFEIAAPVQFSLSRNSTILIRTFSEEENDIFKKFRTTYGAVMCETTLQSQPKECIREIFKELEQDKIPENVRHRPYLWNGDCPNLANFPEPFVKFCQQSELEADDLTKDTWSLFRWKFNLPNPHHAFHKIDKMWSFADEKWKKQPTKDSLISEMLNSYRITQEDCDLIARDLKKGVREPLAHQLFREAWTSRFQNRNSSMVIGVAALETSVKSYIAHRIPDASWLVKELQSPPVIKIIREYLPNLIELKDLFISQPIIKELEKAVQIRNNIVHGKTNEFDLVRLSNILVYIKEVIYLLDYHSGHEWAKQHARFVMINVHDE